MLILKIFAITTNNTVIYYSYQNRHAYNVVSTQLNSSLLKMVADG